MLHNLLESLNFSPLITPSMHKHDPAYDENIRIVGINGVHFMVHSDFRTNRRNIKISSEQFKKLSEGIKDNELANFYYKNKDNLTDIIIEEVGYF